MTGRGRPLATFIVTSVALFMSSLDNLVVTMALPAIKTHLHASLSSLEWTVNAYTLTFAVLLLPGATLGDRFGRKKIFMIGLSIFTTRLGTRRAVDDCWRTGRCTGAAGRRRRDPHPADLDAAQRRRSAGPSWARARRMGRDRRPGNRGRPRRRWRDRRRRLVVVDLLAQRADRHRVAAGRGSPAEGEQRARREARRRRYRPCDCRDCSPSSSVWSRRTTGAGGAARSSACSSPASCCSPSSSRYELRTTDPVLPLRLFRNRGFTASNVAALFMYFGMFGAIFLLAQFLQVAHHYSPLSAGVRTLPWTAMPIFVAPVAGLLSDRIGGRRIVRDRSVPAGDRALLAGECRDADGAVPAHRPRSGDQRIRHGAVLRPGRKPGAVLGAA